MVTKERLMGWLGQAAEEDLRDMLCQWLGCCETCPKPPASAPTDEPDKAPSTTPPESTLPQPLIVVTGSVQGDGFYFMVNLKGPTGEEAPQLFQLDTGAFEMLLTEQAAQALGLPNDGPLDVQGVTGSATAYKSHVSVLFSNTLQFVDVPCVVDPSFTGTPLFGFRFFVDNKLALLVNPVTQQMGLYAV